MKYFLISCKNPNSFAKIVMANKLPIKQCIFIPPPGRERNKIIGRLRGFTVDQLFGVFSLNELKHLTTAPILKKEVK